MTNVVDEVLNTAQTDNKVKYILTRDNGTTENVQIDLLTPVVTQGTPLNKALFDSIQADITSLNNNKLNISSKATNAEAQAGTNTTKYLVPSTMQAKLDKMNGYTGKVISLSSETHSGDNTILNLSDLPATDTGTVIIDIAYYIGGRWNQSSGSQSGSGYYGAFLTFNGTKFRGFSNASEIVESSNFAINGYASKLGTQMSDDEFAKIPIRIEINLNTKTMYIDHAGAWGSPSSSSYIQSRKIIHYVTLTSIVATLKRETNSGKHTLFDYSIYYSR